MSNPIPEFKNEDEEREYWANQDSSEVLDWKQAQRAIFPNLKPTLKSISLRLPESMIDELRQLANERDITGDEVPETFCNWFVADVLDMLGVSMPRYKPADEAGDYVRPHPIYGYDKTKTKPWSATELNRYLGRGGNGKWHRANRVNAVTLANQGTAVVVSIPGHIALVIPGGQGEAVRIAQAGRICGKNLRLEEGFGHREVEFFSYTA